MLGERLKQKVSSPKIQRGFRLGRRFDLSEQNCEGVEASPIHPGHMQSSLLPEELREQILTVRTACDQIVVPSRLPTAVVRFSAEDWSDGEAARDSGEQEGNRGYLMFSRTGMRTSQTFGLRQKLHHASPFSTHS